MLRDRPRIRFVLTMAAFAIVLWMVFRDSVMGPVLVPLRAVTAEATLRLIALTGLDGIRDGSVIFHSSGFGMEITRGCTGFAGAAILAAGILAYPSSSVGRWTGVLIGIPAFVAVNLVRMTHLYHLGVERSSFFHTAHTVVWQIGMMVTVFCIWFVWVRWTDTREREDRGVERQRQTSLAIH